MPDLMFCCEDLRKCMERSWDKVSIQQVAIKNSVSELPSPMSHTQDKFNADQLPLAFSILYPSNFWILESELKCNAIERPLWAELCSPIPTSNTEVLTSRTSKYDSI
jgi:hypothetical protein